MLQYGNLSVRGAREFLSIDILLMTISDHCKFMDLMGIDKDGVIIVHMGVSFQVVGLSI